MTGGSAPSHAPDVGVVILAGGTSSRVGGTELKQFRWIAGKPMLLHSLQSFMARSDVVSVVCVLPREYVADPPPWIFQCDVDRLLLSIGGGARTGTRGEGLGEMPPQAAVAPGGATGRPVVAGAG